MLRCLRHDRERGNVGGYYMHQCGCRRCRPHPGVEQQTFAELALSNSRQLLAEPPSLGARRSYVQVTPPQ
jgi:hypothetical protein